MAGAGLNVITVFPVGSGSGETGNGSSVYAWNAPGNGINTRPGPKGPTCATPRPPGDRYGKAPSPTKCLPLVHVALDPLPRVPPPCVHAVRTPTALPPIIACARSVDALLSEIATGTRTEHHFDPILSVFLTHFSAHNTFFSPRPMSSQARRVGKLTER